MKAQIIKSQENGRNYGSEKETIGTMSAVVNTREGMKEAVTVRFYMARRSDGASLVYCSIWIMGKGLYASGTGKAGGYGYHKRSAALQYALDSAGVTLSEPIDGRGDSSMRDALEAVCRALGYSGQVLIVEH